MPSFLSEAWKRASRRLPPAMLGNVDGLSGRYGLADHGDRVLGDHDMPRQRQHAEIGVGAVAVPEPGIRQTGLERRDNARFGAPRRRHRERPVEAREAVSQRVHRLPRKAVRPRAAAEHDGDIELAEPAAPLRARCCELVGGYPVQRGPRRHHVGPGKPVMLQRDHQIEAAQRRSRVLDVHDEGSAAGGAPHRSRNRCAAPAAADQQVGPQGCGRLFPPIRSAGDPAAADAAGSHDHGRRNRTATLSNGHPSAPAKPSACDTIPASPVVRTQTRLADGRVGIGTFVTVTPLVRDEVDNQSSAARRRFFAAESRATCSRRE